MRVDHFDVSLAGHGAGLDTQSIIERLLRVVDVVIAAGRDNPPMLVEQGLLTVEGNPFRRVETGTCDYRAPSGNHVVLIAMADDCFVKGIVMLSHGGWIVVIARVVEISQQTLDSEQIGFRQPTNAQP